MPMARVMFLLALALPAPVLATAGSGASGPSLNCDSWYETAVHGQGFRSVKDFGAKGDGVTDDTVAIRRAIDHGRGGKGDFDKSPAVVYMPPGTYAVSDTLVLWYWTSFQGSATCPPTILLRPHSAGFGDTGAFKPVITTTAGYNLDPVDAATGYNYSWWLGDIDANCNFYTQLHHVRVTIGEGNDGATGVLWRVAQQTSMRDVHVDATHGAVGIDVGMPPGYAHGGRGQGGGGTVEHVRVVGGRYGVRGMASQWLLREVDVSGASVACVWMSSWIFSLVGLRAHHCPVGLLLTGTRASTILDTRFGNTSTAAISIADNSTLVLDNVSAVNTPWVVQGLLPTQSAAAGAAAVRSLHVDSWHASFSAGLAFEHGVALTGPGALSGFLTPQRGAGSQLATVPTRARPHFGPRFISALDHGAAADGVTDDTAALRRTLAAAAQSGVSTVFLPGGQYLLSDTVTLGDNVQLVGEGLTRLILAPHSRGFGDRRRPKALIATPDDAMARVVLADLMFEARQGNPGATLLDWQVGEASSVFDVSFRIYEPVATLLHIHGNGGGLFTNVWGWAGDHNQTTMVETNVTNPVGLLVEETQQPLFLVGTAFEHHIEVDYHFKRARNVLAIATDTESPYFPPFASSSMAVLVQNCTELLIFGSDYNNWFGRSESLVNVTNSANVSMYAMWVAESGSTAIGGDRQVPKGNLNGARGIVADVQC